MADREFGEDEKAEGEEDKHDTPNRLVDEVEGVGEEEPEDLLEAERRAVAEDDGEVSVLQLVGVEAEVCSKLDESGRDAATDGELGFVDESVLLLEQVQIRGTCNQQAEAQLEQLVRGLNVPNRLIAEVVKHVYKI